MDSGWTFFGAGQQGLLHRGQGQGNQDAHAWFNGTSISGAVVADGAGSAKYSAIGSWAAATAVLAWLRRADLHADRARRDPLAGLTEARHALDIESARLGVAPRQLATTLAYFVAEQDSSLHIVQYGDSETVLVDMNGSLIPSRPAKFGEYFGETVFVTDGSYPDAVRVFEVPPGSVRGVVLMTDGLMPVASDQSRDWFQPFFADCLSFASSPDATQRGVQAFLRSIQARGLCVDDLSLVIGVHGVTSAVGSHAAPNRRPTRSARVGRPAAPEVDRCEP